MTTPTLLKVTFASLAFGLAATFAPGLASASQDPVVPTASKPTLSAHGEIPGAIEFARRGRGADDGAGHVRGGRRGRGADDAPNHAGMPVDHGIEFARRGRGADDKAGHVRGGRGADDTPNHG